jgi:division protein CdvB (Snf7/Vps24/ESCRT-III family)
MRQKLRAMEKTTVQEAQARLSRLVPRLQEVREELHQVIAMLPVPSGVQESDSVADEATEVRSVCECVLSDSINPAIRDLGSASSYRAGQG